MFSQTFTCTIYFLEHIVNNIGMVMLLLMGVAIFVSYILRV